MILRWSWWKPCPAEGNKWAGHNLGDTTDLFQEQHFLCSGKPAGLEPVIINPARHGTPIAVPPIPDDRVAPGRYHGR